MSDADGDSTMHSSPRSSVSDDLFPGADSTNVAAMISNPAGESTLSNSSSVAGGVPLPSTPAANIIKTGELSPPNSQGAPALPPLAGSSSSTTASAGAGGATVQDATTINANGKRVYHTANTGAALEAKGKSLDPQLVNNGADVSISGGIMLEGGVAVAASDPSSSKPLVPSVHAASGYRWEREADAPGWAWKNKKAQEDWYKAEETFVDRDRMVKARYGDPLEAGGVDGRVQV